MKLVKKLLLASALALAFVTTVNAGEIPIGCFARTYDSAHLAAHPDQIVRAVKLRLYKAPPDARFFALEMQLRGRDKPLKTGGYCKGAACKVECDGGGVNIAPSGDDVMMRLDRIRMVACDASDIELFEGGEDVTGGKDDRVFRLYRAPDALCGRSR